GVLRRGREGAEFLTNRLGIAGSLATAIPVIFAYAEYAAGRVLGQYLIPMGYFAAVVASAVVFQRLLGSKRLLIVAVSALFVFSVVSLGTNSPDLAPLEHTNFQAASTITPYHSYLESADVSSLIPANPAYRLYYY